MSDRASIHSAVKQFEDIKSDPVSCVNELLTSPSITLKSLLYTRKVVQTCADDTNTQLKKNVYKNYQLFIDTSKEVSYMKSEMSHVNELLTNQANLLESIINISIGGSKTGLSAAEKKEAMERVKEERERKMLQMSKSNLNGPNLPTKDFKSIIETIDGGGTGVLENRASSLVYHDGEVIELDDQKDYKELHGVYLVLLNDSLIISLIVPERVRASNPHCRKYKLQSVIDLETIAVVNVKDRRYPKFEMAFKILMSATTKMFLTSSAANKKQWMEAFELAKNYRRTSRLQRQNTMLFSSANNPTNATFDLMTSVPNSASNAGSQSKSSFSSNNPFDDAEIEEDDNCEDPEVPAWLVDLPDDLDVCLAQRNFDEAVKLANKVQNHYYNLQSVPKWSENQMHVDLRLKIDNKISELVDALSSELNVAPDRSVQTGPRASRRAVSWLLRLDKTSLAIRLFLDQRSRILKHQIKQNHKQEGATTLFMKNMTDLLFMHLIDTSKEFLRAFQISVPNLYPDPNADSTESNKSLEDNSVTPTVSYTALACLNRWNHDQFKQYLSLFKRHVFISQVNHSEIASCVGYALKNCAKLRQSIGVDFAFLLSSQLNDDIQRVINDMTNKLLETIKLRANDESNNIKIFESKEHVKKFVEEMKSLHVEVDDLVQSIPSTESNGKHSYSLPLTANTISFVKTYIKTQRDLLKFAETTFLYRYINEKLVILFKSQMRYLVGCMNSQQRDNSTVRTNIAFLLDRVVPVIVKHYCTAMNVRTFPEMQNLVADYAYLKESNNNSSHHSVNNTTRISISSTPERSPLVKASSSSSASNSPMPAPRYKSSSSNNKTRIQVIHNPSPQRANKTNEDELSRPETPDATYL